MDFGELAGKAQELAGQHAEQVEAAGDQAGKMAGERLGHQEQIDQGVAKFKEWVPGGEGAEAPPAEGEEGHPPVSPV